MAKASPKKKRARSGKTTIYDIAREAGVSTGTVSRALNNSSGINEDTRQKVLEISRRLGVRRRSSIKRAHFALVIPARSQKSPRPQQVDQFVYNMMIELSIRGCAMSVFSESQLESLRRGIFDGIFSVSWEPLALEVMNSVNDTPVIILNRFQDPGHMNVVGWNHISEGRIVAEYFLNRGHRQLAFLAPQPMNREANQLRLRGMQEAAAAAGCPIEDGCIELLEEGSPLYAALQRIIKRGADAVFVPGHGRFAMEVTNVVQGVMKLCVPDDISVIGGESQGWSLLTNPPMTAVRVPYEEIVVAAVDLMYVLIQDKGQGQPRERLLDISLIERKSVADRTST